MFGWFYFSINAGFLHFFDSLSVAPFESEVRGGDRVWAFEFPA